MQLKGYQCSLYINLQKISNFLLARPNPLNDKAGVSSISELIPQTAETMILKYDFQELEKQKANLAVDQKKKETNSCKVIFIQISPVKSKFTNRSFRENDKRRKKFMRDNFDKEKNGQEKKKAKRDNLDGNLTKQFRIYENKVKKAMLVNLNDERKKYIKLEGNERKKEKRDNEKKHLKKQDDKREKENRDNLDDNEKEHLGKHEKRGNKVMYDKLDDENKII